MKNIRRKAFDMKTVRLSPEEGFVLSRLDAPLSVKDLVSLTGIEEGRIVEIVDGLANQGAIDVDREAPAPAAGPVTKAVQSSQTPAVVRVAKEEAANEEEPQSDASVEKEAAEAADAEEAEEAEDPEEEKKAVDGTREYQKIYEAVFAPMDRDKRLAAAQTEDGSNLYALCLDPDPQIIIAILGNPHTSLGHARMIAWHHRTHVGLDALSRRSELLADTQVQRRILANPQLPDNVLRKIVNPKLLTDVYKIAINREIPEKSRVLTRELLNKKFMLGSADEKAALLIKTEGRCLILLVNAALDARATQILTSKTSYTILFIQNLARWSATPPALLVHLLKQPVVRQNIGLRKMLLKHRNVPSETKKMLS
jgi:hypothetical protein